MSLRRRVLLLGLNLSVAAFVYACSAPSGDTAGSTDDAITGSLGSARACVVRDAYRQASVSAFTSISKSQLPDGVTTTNPTTIARFDVDGQGNIYVVEEGNVTSFYDPFGRLVAKATVGAGGALSWSQATGAALQCGAPGSDAGPHPPVGDDDDDDGDAGSAGSCLALAPIDETQFPYAPHAPSIRGACTARELSDISAYYRANASSLSMTGWKSAVSARCGSCVFGDVSEGSWRPLLAQDDGFVVNRGGCIAAASRSEECGRAYQQYQDCLVEACTIQCTTQSEYTACRQDERVLTTSCRAATERVRTSCGNGLSGYETTCKGTSYTFEGPIKAMCITGLGATLSDAGAP